MLRVYHASALPLLGHKGGEGLSQYRRERLARITAPKAYALSLGAELLLLAALRDLELPVTEPLDITCGDGGKPALAGGPEFSLSHSGERVLCALSDGAVGADIQQLRPYNPALAHRFFTTEEGAWLKAQRERELGFTLLWSLKESYVKFRGSGIAGVHLDSFTVRVAPDGRACIPGSGVKLWYTVGEGYTMSVCSAADAAPETVRELHFK
ncbi:MAG: 4'-phosphopantetheinyl transferase family protein [Candidatus Limivicinus sp.]